MTNRTSGYVASPGRWAGVVLLMGLLLALAVPAAGAEEDAGIEKVRLALQGKQYDAAVAAADAYIAATGKLADEAAYLKAVALFHAGKFDAAADAAEVVLKQYAASPWSRKAMFLKGSALARARKFEQAEKVYEAEANRLLSGARKKEIAGIIVKYADQLATEPDRKDIAAPPANYAKAYSLYNKALTLEIDTMLREEVLFKRAVTIQRAGNHTQAVTDFALYLAEFDPLWSGLTGAEPRLETASIMIPTGSHRFDARHLLARSLIDSGQPVQARPIIEDLLAALAKTVAKSDIQQAQAIAPLIADANWEFVRTFQMPDGPVEELERAVKAAADFLKRYPNHVHSFEAAYLIARSYENKGRADQAVAAYEAFLKGDNYKLPPGDLATTVIKRLGATPLELSDTWSKLAVFQIGQLRFNQRKFTEAIAAWQRYVSQFPNGPQWAQAQRSIITAEFMIAIDAVAQKKYDEARKLFEAYLAQHPLDERVGQVLFTLGTMYYAQAQKLEEDKAKPEDVAAVYRKAVDEWSRLVSKYPNTEESSLALYRVGLIYEEKLGDLDKALESYRRLTWGAYAASAQSRVAIMTQKHLALTTERTFRTNEPAKVKLSVRNIEKVTVRQYYLDLEAYFRKTHIIGGVEGLDIALIAADKQWDVKVDNYAKYKPIDTTIEIPFEKNSKAGVCIINISEDDLESTTLVVRSDLDLIMKTSRRELLVYLQDMVGNKPAAGVDVFVSDGTKVIATGKTGVDGVFLQKIEGLEDCKTVRVFARKEGSVASNILSLHGLSLSSGLSAKGYIYTDRPAYQPGQLVNVRGIIRDVKDGQYTVPANAAYVVTVSDPSGRLLREETLPLSEFGTFNTKMFIDEGAPLGSYSIVVRPKDKTEIAYNGTFTVQRFQLEKMQVKLDFDRRVYFRGESVKATVTAEYYWGEPVIGRQIRYTLPDGRTMLATTDKKGRFEFAFDTTPMPVGRPLPFSVRIEGENIGFNDAVFLSRVGFNASVKAARDLVLSGEPFDVTVKTTTPDGKPVKVDGMKLIVLRREVRKADPVLSAVPWLNWAQQQQSFDLNEALSNNAAINAPSTALLNEDAWAAVADVSSEVTVSEHDVKTDEKTGEGVVRLTLEKGGQYILRVAGKDRFDQTIVAQNGVFVSDDEDATKLRLFSDRETLKVGEKAKVTLHSRLDGAIALVTFEGETILSYRLVELKKGANVMDVDIAHAHYPNFSVAAAAMDGRDLRLVSKPFRVERQLNITLKPVKNTYAPGDEAKVEILVTDQLGNPVKAELSLSLVDAALHALFGDGAAPILPFFQEGAFRQSQFLAISTCNFKYTGVTRGVMKELLEENERLTRAELETRELARVQTELSAQTLDDLPVVTGGFGRPGRPQANAPQNGQQLFGAFDSENDEKDGVQLRSAGGVNRYYSEYGRAIQPGQHAGVQAGLQTKLNEELSKAQGFVHRQDLPDAGYWIPSIISGADGKATATIPMPGNTTKWRLTGKGISVDTLVGEATAEIIARKDFFVELKAPPALREGDKPRVLARVHNLTDYAGPVKLTLAVSSGSKKYSGFTQIVTIEKQATSEFLFDAIDTPAIGSLTFEVTAEAGDQQRDALAKTVNVQPWGLEFADHGGGTATGNAAVSLELPKGQAYGSRWLTVTIGPSLKQAVIDMAMGEPPVMRPMDRMILPPRPLGTFAGTELLAVVGGLEYAQQVSAPPKAFEALASRARSLVTSLVVSQQASGGWPWQAFGEGKATADWAVTSTSYWALVRANQLGIKVNADTLKKAEAYLQTAMSQVQSADNEARAVIVHALSVSKVIDFTHVNSLHRDRQRLSPISLAYTALAFTNLDRNELAGEVLAVLESRVKSLKRDERDLAYWSGEGRYPWLNDEVETTAIALLAMVKVKPGSPLADKAAEYLLNARGCYGFTPAKSRGPAVAALAAHFGRGRAAGEDYKLAVLVNGKEVKALDRKGETGTVRIDVPADALKDGPNMVTFRMEGQGQYAYAATLRGFSPEMKDPKSVLRDLVINRSYRHATLEYRGKPINASSSSPVKNLEIGQRTRVTLDIYNQNTHNSYLVIEESLPAGARLVEGSLQGQFRHVEFGDSKITMYYGPGEYPSGISYELVGYATGEYRALPTVVRDAIDPGKMRVFRPDTITVLPPGVPSPDPYQMNDGERFALGTAYFNDGLYKQALDFLPALFDRETKYAERDVARMLLWVHTDGSYYDARRVVETSEVLRRRFPDLIIPFEKILTVGRAYRDIGEFERAMLVFQATIDNSFINDSNVSAILADEGQFVGSIDYQEALWREYPDTPEVIGSYFALAQMVYLKAPEAHLIARQERIAALSGAPKPAAAANGHDPKRNPTKVDMLRQTIAMLSTFLTHYPEDPLADDAAFSMSNVLLDLKAYEAVVKLSAVFRQRYEKSDFSSSFQYMIALGHFWRRDYEPALKAAKVVADGDSKDRDFARYILGQVYHAEGKPGDAITWYKLVESKYGDAKQAIDYFEEKRIGIEEVSIVRPGKPVELKIKYRNIKEAALQVYKVDLMKLYLREKNLSRITAVNLAGISPQLTLTEQLGDGKDYTEKEKTATLALKDEGAYLVICRGDDLFASGLVLITPLEIEVQEDAAAGQVRANVIDKVKGLRPAEVHVKAIGSADTKFKSGETDLRGLFIAEGLRGTATVIARDSDSRYAFYRGKNWIGQPLNAAPNAPAGRVPPGSKPNEVDYGSNLKQQQNDIQLYNSTNFDKLRRQQNKGVDVNKAFK
jgi:uncharacterized protein YfaS (alpha-2-macroglobulin family)/tetratricopeptide (TPR) repeat protein